MILISIFFTFVLRTIIARLWYVPRPYIVDPRILLFPVISRGDSSFFSAHTSVAFAIVGIMFWQKNSKYKIAYLAVASIIGLSRILAGYHYWWDVLVGGICGLLISYFVEKYYFKLKKTLKRVLDN